MQKNKIAIIVLSVLLAVSAGYIAYTEGVKFYNAKINQAYTKGVLDVFGTVKSKGQVSVQLDDGMMTLVEQQ